MTSRIFSNALKKIEAARKQGCYLEAMLHAFHLNTELVKELLSSAEEFVNQKASNA